MISKFYIKETQQLIRIPTEFLEPVSDWFPAIQTCFEELGDYKAQLQCGTKFIFNSKDDCSRFIRYLKASEIMTTKILEIMKTGFDIDNELDGEIESKRSALDKAHFIKSDEFSEYLRERINENRPTDLKVNVIDDINDAEEEIIRVMTELSFSLFDEQPLKNVKDLFATPLDKFFDLYAPSLQQYQPKYLAFNILSENKLSLLAISGNEEELEYIGTWMNRSDFKLEKSAAKNNVWEVADRESFLDWLNALLLHFNLHAALKTVLNAIDQNFSVDEANTNKTNIYAQMQQLADFAGNDIQDKWRGGLAFLNTIIESYGAEPCAFQSYSIEHFDQIDASEPYIFDLYQR